jgi:membrane protein YqaA with SNARE-associated domain
MAHLARVVGVIAADAINAADREQIGTAGDRQGSHRREINNVFHAVPFEMNMRLAGNPPGPALWRARGILWTACAEADGIIGDCRAQRQTGARTRYRPRIAARTLEACKNAAMIETLSLWALFASSFLAATLLPGGSEFVLFGVIKLNPQQTWPALAIATLGNTLGGMSSYLIGRVFPQKYEIKGIEWVKRYGSGALLLAWVPIIGDPLCVAAGWLRLNPWWSALFMAIGKFARYLVIVGIAGIAL